MKRLVSKIKKIVISIITAIMYFPNKIFAVGNPIEIRPDILYGVPQDLYGVPSSPQPIPIIWRVARTFIIPIALLIGLMIYFKKSKSSTKKKILVTIGIIAITAILYFVVNKIIYELA